MIQGFPMLFRINSFYEKQLMIWKIDLEVSFCCPLAQIFTKSQQPKTVLKEACHLTEVDFCGTSRIPEPAAILLLGHSEKPKTT